MPSLIKVIGLDITEMYSAHARPIKPVIWNTGPEKVSANPMR